MRAKAKKRGSHDPCTGERRKSTLSLSFPAQRKTEKNMKVVGVSPAPGLKKLILSPLSLPSLSSLSIEEKERRLVLLSGFSLLCFFLSVNVRSRLSSTLREQRETENWPAG